MRTVIGHKSKCSRIQHVAEALEKHDAADFNNADSQTGALYGPDYCQLNPSAMGHDAGYKRAGSSSRYVEY